MNTRTRPHRDGLRLLRWSAVGALLGLVALPAFPGLTDLSRGLDLGQPLPPPTTLTIYQGQNLALVEQQRALELYAQGPIELRLEGLSPRLLPASVRLEPLDPNARTAPPFRLLEQRVEWTPASMDALLDAHIGRTVEVITAGGLRRYRGTLLSTQGGLVLRDESGRVHALKDVQQVRFPTPASAPPADPAKGAVLVGLVHSRQPGTLPVRLSYLTEGLDWRAEYAAVLGLDEKRLDLESWVAVSNDTGMRFEGARLHLVAGRLHRVVEGLGARKEPFEAQAQAAPAPPGPEPGAPFEARAAFEYHLYALRRPATLPDGQAVRLAFLEAESIPVEKRYVYEAHRWDGVQVWIEFENAGAWGQPLPAGRVRLYKRTPQGLQFIGEDLLRRHTPVGERVRLFAGLAFDLVAERTVLKEERVGDRVYRRTVRLTLSNRKAEGVEIAVREAMPGDWTILSANRPHERVDARTAGFSVALAPGETAVVEYTVEYRL